MRLLTRTVSICLPGSLYYLRENGEAAVVGGAAAIVGPDEVRSSFVAAKL